MDIALFSPSSLFGDDDDASQRKETEENQQSYEERIHLFPGTELLIREFTFHELNANLLWPGTFSFAEWLVQYHSLLEGRRIIELGSFGCDHGVDFANQRGWKKFWIECGSSFAVATLEETCGTGALAIFLRKVFGVDITTSDFNDKEIEENIAHNCRANGIIPALPHIRHSWGETFPTTNPVWDLIIASDILLYVKQYPNLIKSLSFLLKSYNMEDKKRNTGSSQGDVELPWPAFLMSWRRRIGKEEESLFFTGCEEAGLAVKHVGSRVYCIGLGKITNAEQEEKEVKSVIS